MFSLNQFDLAEHIVALSGVHLKTHVFKRDMCNAIGLVSPNLHCVRIKQKSGSLLLPDFCFEIFMCQVVGTNGS